MFILASIYVLFYIIQRILCAFLHIHSSSSDIKHFITVICYMTVQFSDVFMCPIQTEINSDLTYDITSGYCAIEITDYDFICIIP